VVLLTLVLVDPMHPPSPPGLLLGGLPEDIVGDLFSELLRCNRSSALALAFTSKRHLRLFRARQSAIALPDTLPDVARAIAYVLPAATPATRTLVLSRQALDPAVADLWAGMPALPGVRTLHIPALRRSPLFHDHQHHGHQNHNQGIHHTGESPRALAQPCLLPILSRLPGLTTLSVSLAAPGPDPALSDLPDILSARPDLPYRRFLPNLNKLIVTSTGPYLHPDAQHILPVLLRALSKCIVQFSIVLPPRIIPADFIADILGILAEAPLLQEARLTLPFYNFLLSQPGYSAIPHLKSLTLGAISFPSALTSPVDPSKMVLSELSVSQSPSARSQLLWMAYDQELQGPSHVAASSCFRKANSAGNALLSHLPEWRSLELLTIHSASSESLDILFEALHHRVLSIVVAKRPLRSPLSFDWLSSAPWRFAPVGIDRDGVKELFHRRFCNHHSDVRAVTCTTPLFDNEAASRVPRHNYLAIRLMVGGEDGPASV
jgi:hypothetical protein